MALLRKRPNQRHIANIVGTSQVAVSKALSGAPDLSANTRERILRVAEELGYRPNRLMSNVYAGRTKFIGAFIPLFALFFQKIFHGIEREAFDKGYSVIPIQMIADSDTDEYEISLLLENRVDGLIINPRCIDRNQQLYSELLHNGEKIVFINQKVSIPGACCVYSNDIMGSQLAIDCLYGHGHRAIAYVCAGQTMSSTSRFRQEGYLSAMKQFGLKTYPEWLLNIDDTFADSVFSLLEHFPEITAFFCETDYHALELMKILENAGIRIPRDISVIGYGDTIAHVDFMRVPLTTIFQGGESMGRTAMKLLLQMLNNKKESITGNFVQKVQLVERESVCFLKRER